MPIAPVVLQRRLVEVGRIRLGVKAPTAKGGTRPDKLDRFRFTSPHERHIAALADLYGGEARPWDNAGKREHEVITDARAVPVVVVPGGFSQWMETWSGGGCVHRCDGVTDEHGDSCDVNDPAHKAAKPTTRLSVMLRDLEALGTWRLESHGWNAAAELPGMVDIAGQVGRYVRASLTLAERVAIKDGKTSRFVVPSLDLEVTPERLTALTEGTAAGRPAAVTGGAQTAIAAGPEAPARDWQADVEAIATKDDARALWQDAPPAIRDLITARVAWLEEQAAPVTPVAPEPPASDDEVADATIEPDETPAAVNAAWQALISAAGERYLSLDAVDRLLADLYPGVPAGQHTAAQMHDALASLPRAAA